MRFKFRKENSLRFNEPANIQEIRHELAAWQRAADNLLPSYSRDDDVMRGVVFNQIHKLEEKLNIETHLKHSPSTVNLIFKTNLAVLQSKVFYLLFFCFYVILIKLYIKYNIKDRVLLTKSLVVLSFILCSFLLHAIPHITQLSLGWTALLGFILLMILTGQSDITSILHHVEWSTLLFFAALFVFVECLQELGFIPFIGELSEKLILHVPAASRLTVAQLLVLWVVY